MLKGRAIAAAKKGPCFGGAEASVAYDDDDQDDAKPGSLSEVDATQP